MMTYDIKRRYDADMEAKVNGMLSKVFGEGTAYAMIDSTWTYDKTESLTRPTTLRTRSRAPTTPGQSAA